VPALPAPERESHRPAEVRPVSLTRALELAAAAAGRAYPNPTVGAVVLAADGSVAGEGATEAYGGRHGEVVALDEAGERARGGTLYLTMEPCTHHGRTPPCVDRVLAAGVARVVVGSLDPNPQAAGGLERLREAGVETELVDSVEARRQNEAWRTWVGEGRPFVVYKVAATLDGRTALPDERWITGEESRRLVHELRARVDAVAVGSGTARADRPLLTARGVETPRGQPRRLVFGSSLPDDLGLELRTGPLADELRALAGEGVQSLLLEGGATLAAAFLAADLVDRLLVFVAPTLAGAGPGVVAGLPAPLRLHRLEAQPVGGDVLLSAYLHEP
jgi:diaminohydroxyphosphoribosylaminopyrimidine deaminase/5-amino-6-(5-phosphoribosylamino)uracil reductase